MKYVAVITLLLWVQNIDCQVREGQNCVDKTSKKAGRCLQPQNCHSANDNFFKRGRRPTFCEYTKRRILLCCVQEQRHANRNRPSKQPARQGNNKAPKLRQLERVSERKCKEYNKNVPTFFNTQHTYVFGGSNSSPREFPHMGAIAWRNFDGGYKFGCGGSVISPRFILTAGHCSFKAKTVNPVPVIVRLGNVDLDPKYKNGYPIIDVKIKSIHKHPDYKPPSRYNDIALVELAEALKFSEDVRPACLWTKPDFGEHKSVIATGWGVTENSTTTSDILQNVRLNLYSNQQCDIITPRNRYWDGFAPTQMCAGELNGGKDTCQGDSGAPIQVMTEPSVRVYHIMGLTSFGGRCAQKGSPAVYTRVSSYIDWIEDIVWPNQ
ncbi:PREDICTED: serine protease snake-like [Papilio polytes]|uniref:serine protease snake-like n=1 Tax=Papilio polytes TaxID=76194 RepID=UPI000676247A|nr:PREDICTED: serine protease snake-like [Papilio polytes]